MEDRRLTRRRYHRIDSSLVTWFQVKGKRPVSGLSRPDAVVRTKNIAGGGIAFSVPKRKRGLRLSADLELEIQLPTDLEPVRATSRICRLEEEEDGSFDVGVCFTQIGEEDRDRLVAYIEGEEKKRGR